MHVSPLKLLLNIRGGVNRTAVVSGNVWPAGHSGWQLGKATAGEFEAMTEAEFAVLREQVTSLQQQAEQRAKAWRPIGLAIQIVAIGYAVCAMICIIASIWLDARSYPSTHQFVQIMGYQFLFISIPLSLLAQLVRNP
jgi:uncharacterized membrane protein